MCCWQDSVPRWLLARGHPQFFVMCVFPTWQLASSKCSGHSGNTESRLGSQKLSSSEASSLTGHPITFAMSSWLEANHWVRPHSREGDYTRAGTPGGGNHGGPSWNSTHYMKEVLSQMGCWRFPVVDNRLVQSKKGLCGASIS